MVTTIQVNERTLEMLRKLKQSLNASSYDETIVKIAVSRTKGESLAGNLKKYLRKQSTKDILRELQEERRKSDRF